MTTKTGPKIRVAPKPRKATVLDTAGPLAAVQEGTGRYPYKVVRPSTGGFYTTVSQGFSSAAEALADLRLRSGLR